MGIFGAGSGGLLVVATGNVELAFSVLRIIDDSVDLLRNSHICLLQELRVGRLLLGLGVGGLSIAAPGRCAGHGRWEPNSQPQTGRPATKRWKSTRLSALTRPARLRG